MHLVKWPFLFIVLAAVAFSQSAIAADVSDPIPAPIVTFDLAKLPDAQFDKSGWSDPATEGGIGFRKVLSAKAGRAEIKAWWKEGDLRPARGDTFIFEVKYQDVLTKPARFLVHSGIGVNFSNSALHYFGGSHDGQWKTANIPCSWDMICRLVSSVDPAQNAPEMTAFYIVTGEDLPVASVTVRKSVPDDEVRFYAECRAQIAAAQADERGKNPVPAVKEAPGITGPMGIFPWEATANLMPNQTIPKGEFGKPVKVRMCEDQLEGGSFGVYANGAPLTAVDYDVSPLVDSSGNTLKAGIERRTAEYSILDKVWTPMRLWPAYATDIQAGRCQWFYFNVETHRGETRPGVYKGKITVHSREGSAELPLEVDVLPIDLMTIEEAGITMHGCYGSLPPLHDIEFEHRYNYSGALIWYSSTAIPMALKDGKLVFDYTYPDDWMKGARDIGFTDAIWYLGGDPFGFPRTLNLIGALGTLDKKMTREEWCHLQGEPANRDHVLPEARKLFVDWIRQVNAHALASNWPELLPTPHDEPQKWASSGIHGDKKLSIGTGAWIKPFFKDACAAIREADSRIRVYGCIHHVKGWHGIADLWSVFINDIDVYMTNAAAEDSDIGNKVRHASAESIKKGGKGKLFWQYTGLGGGKPDSERYSFGFYFGSFGSTGCTAWAYNWHDTWDLSGLNGDIGVTAWSTPYQTIPTPWMEGQREGLDDRRVIATYQKRFAGDPAAMKVLQDILDQAMNSRSKKSGNDTVTNFFEAVDDAHKLVKWRDTLLDKLAAAGQK